MAVAHLLATAGWLTGWALLARVPRLPPVRTADGDDEAVTIVIPARNEAERLPLLLGDLATLRPEGARVIVVDDHSEDDTAAIAGRHPFVEVIATPPVEEGWIGKSWACHHGAREAGAGTLVFLDADVRLDRDALARVLEARRRHGGLVSVWPYHTVRRPYEHLSALPTIITLMTVGCGSVRTPRHPRAAFGPVMATSVEDYRASGGHEAVRSDVIDDFALAARYSDAGRPVTSFAGGRAVQFRMYPHGLKALVDGWSKSMVRGGAAFAWWRLAGVLFWLTCAIGAITWAQGIPRPHSVLLSGAFAFQIFVMLRQAGSFGVLDALLYPVHVVAAALLFTLSLWRTVVRRQVQWRGRTITVQRTRSD